MSQLDVQIACANTSNHVMGSFLYERDESCRKKLVAFTQMYRILGDKGRMNWESYSLLSVPIVHWNRDATDWRSNQVLLLSAIYAFPFPEQLGTAMYTTRSLKERVKGK